ncbi:MAG: peptidylprolyl isomerase [Thermodesulfovibrionales bacterium]
MLAGLRLLFFPLAVLLCCACLKGSSVAAPEDRILAEVNGETVTSAEYRLFVLKDPAPGTGNAFDEKVLIRLIEEKLILQEAAKKGVTVSDNDVEQSIRDFQLRNSLSQQVFEKTITDKGMELAEYKKWLKDNIIVIAKITASEVDSKVVLTEKDISDYYDHNRNLFIKDPEKIQAGALIMLMSENPSPDEITMMKLKSIRIYNELKKGASFEAMAELYSEDPSREKKGIIGEFRRGDLVPELDNKLFSLREGEVSEPVWAKEGIYILKHVRSLRETYVPLRDAREHIQATLLKERREQRYRAWVKSLWERSKIDIY